MENALDIHVTGIVQGVGFRPFVYRCARHNLIRGWVLNAVDGVHIRAQGDEDLVDAFVLELVREAPAAAHIAEVTMHEVPLEDFDGFEIRFSEDAEVDKTTLVSPDLATCPDCVRELFDPADRRFRYPFINCTNCGPRFTIIDSLPYDRAATSMRDFEMCPSCAREYADPADRRFHAQPDACFDCGPHVSWWEGERAGEGFGDISPLAQTVLSSHGQSTGLSGSCGTRREHMSPQPSDAGSQELLWGTTREESDAIFARAVELLRAGGIVAVKGLGGFHLVCDAQNAEAVARLRARKHRDGKALAVMVADVASARAWCTVSAEEEAVLTGAAHPIVLVRKRTDAAAEPFTPGLADGLAELGVMLPYTPVQHLLMHDFAEAGGRMLVMTSGNVHDEPIQTRDDEARVALAGIADAFLGNNREIRARYDDSVVRVIDAAGQPAIQVIRRARGFSPVPIALPKMPDEGGSFCAGASEAGAGAAVDAGSASSAVTAPAVFAAGPEQKNTFCLTRGTEAFASQHIGDLENAQTFDAWLEAKARFEELFRTAPTAFACDMHPEYLSTKWVRENYDRGTEALSENYGRGTGAPSYYPVVDVQHHHAHIVSAMAEHDFAGPVCGIAFDGTGYGMDGAIWGGEVLLANLRDFERFANFCYVPMPGGAAAVRNPLRMAWGVLYAFDLLEHPAAAAALKELGEADRALLARMVEQGINTPYTSSAGRLFDAASALLGVCPHPTYEGEPAILLEACMSARTPGTEDIVHAAESHSIDDEKRAAWTISSVPGVHVHPDPRYTIAIVKNTATPTSTAHDTSVLLLDAQPTFAALLDDLAAGVPRAVIAQRFHDAFVEAIVTVAQLVEQLYGIRHVALSGGVFMNRYLVEHALAELANAGFAVLINKDLPPNDGCIAYGQAVVATQRLAAATA